METSYGLKFEFVRKINPHWSNYDKTITECHLQNVGVIIIDAKYQTPLDCEFDLEEIYQMIETVTNGEVNNNILQK